MRQTDLMRMSLPGFSIAGFAGACAAALLISATCGESATVDQRIRTAQQALSTAQTKANQSRQAWEKAHQELAKAQSAHQKASNQVYQARELSARQHAPEVGMAEVITERDAAWRQINARRNRLAAEVKVRPDYQSAEKEAEVARQRLTELPQDKSLSEDEQKDLSSDLSARIRRPGELRKETETKDKELREATERWQSASKKITQLQPLLKRAIDEDPAVTKAMEAEKQATSALDKAQTTLTRAEHDLNAAQANVDRQNELLQSAMDSRRRTVRRSY